MFSSWFRQPHHRSTKKSSRRRRQRPSNCRKTFQPSIETMESRAMLTIIAPVQVNDPVGSTPAAVVIGDLNGDGRADTVVANRAANTVSVLMGNGDGSLQSKIDYPVGTSPVGVVLGDFNGDGKVDIATANFGAGTVSILLGNGDGTFRPKTDFAVAATPVSLTTGDFNGDGHLDLAVAAETTANDSVSILRGVGDGTFAAPVNIITDAAPRFAPTLPFPSMVASGDFNGDGHTDLVVVNNKDTPTFGRTIGQNLPGTASVLLGNGDATFQAPRNFAVGTSPGPVVTGDFNADGLLDFAVANRVSGTVSVFAGAGGGNFQQRVDYAAFDPVSLVTGDFNGDGRSDLAVSDLQVGPTVTILSGQPGGTLLTTATYVAPPSVGPLATGDLNGDGHPDLIVATTSQSTITPWLNKGSGAFAAYPLIANPGVTLSSQAFADFNGDGILDKAFINVGKAEIELGLGDGQFGDAVSFAVSPSPTSVAAADVDGNGTPDLLVGDVNFGNMVALLSNSPGWDNRTGGAVGFTVSAPQQVTAGAASPVTVTAVDALGNPVPGFLGTVDIDDLAPGATSQALQEQYSFTAADAGRHTFLVSGLTKAGANTLSVFAVAMPTATVGVNVVPGSLSKLVLAAPSSTPAGAPFSFTLTPEDAFGNVETAYAGTVHFGALANDTQAVLPADYTFTAADAGTHTFGATLFKTTGASMPLITAKDLATGITGFTNVLVTPLAPASLSMTRLPSPLPAGAQDGVFVSALDIYGNQATSYAGTVHFSSSDIQAALPADYTFTALDQGGHVFYPVLKTVGTQSLSVADTLNPGFSSTQLGIAVVPGAIAKWVVSGWPAFGVTGAAQSFTLTAMDGFGNVATNYFGTVHFASSDALAGLPADYTFTLADGGSHTFSATLKTAGAQSITATDTLNPAVSTTQSITVAPGTAASMTVAGFPPTTAGVAQNFTVTVRDAFGNLATNYTGTVGFSSSDPLASLPPNYTFTAADAGVHTFTATLKKAGSQSITVQDVASASASGTETGINVSPAAVAQFGMVTSASVTQGVGFNITVSALDAFGNVVPSYRGKVHFSTTATNFGLPSDFTFSNNDNGVHIFSVTLNTLGFQTVTVADTTNSSIAGSIVVDVLPKPSGGGGGGVA